MSTVAAPPPAPNRRSLPRAFVAICVLIGAFVGAYVVVTLLSITTASTEHRTRTFQAIEELRIDAGSGDVDVIGEVRRDIRVEMEIQRGMWRGAWQPEIELRPDGRTLQLASDCSLWAHIGVSDCGASFTIRVPRGTAIAVDVSSGDATVAGVDEAVAVDASSGDVRVADVGGPVTLDVSSGDLGVIDHRGRIVSASASSGDVEVRTVVAPRMLRASASSGDVEIVVPDRTYRVQVRTNSGDEDVQVRQDPSARRVIEAEASSGDVTVQRLLDAR